MSRRNIFNIRMVHDAAQIDSGINMDKTFELPDGNIHCAERFRCGCSDSAWIGGFIFGIERFCCVEMFSSQASLLA